MRFPADLSRDIRALVAISRRTTRPGPARVKLGGINAPERFYRDAQMINASNLKRGIDVMGAFAGFFLLMPLMFVLAAAIKIDSQGPIIFRQQRYGAYRRPFMIYKFRTMSVMESVGEFTQARKNDERVTRVGRVLRRLSLDELPQLFNVLRGDMSLVGPRPHAIAMDDRYGCAIDGYLVRHLVRPGLTGLAQVSGHRGPTENDAALHSRLRCDRTYIMNWSIWNDVRIILATPLSLLNKNAL